jgi:hypothetical protein
MLPLIGRNWQLIYTNKDSPEKSCQAGQDDNAKHCDGRLVWLQKMLKVNFFFKLLNLKIWM